MTFVDMECGKAPLLMLSTPSSSRLYPIQISLFGNLKQWPHHWRPNWLAASIDHSRSRIIPDIGLPIHMPKLLIALAFSTLILAPDPWTLAKCVGTPSIRSLHYGKSEIPIIHSTCPVPGQESRDTSTGHVLGWRWKFMHEIRILQSRDFSRGLFDPH